MSKEPGENLWAQLCSGMYAHTVFQVAHTVALGLQGFDLTDHIFKDKSSKPEQL